MTDLMARIEVQKLAALLELEPGELAYVAHLDAASLRTLRETMSTALHSRHAHRFARMAAVSKLVPAAISAKASGLVGPALSAQVAGALDPGHAVKLAKAMKPAFLADVTTFLDPARVGDIIRAMPASVTLPVARTLLERKEFLTLGRFTSIVAPETAVAAAETADGMGLLHLALYTENRPALDAIVSMIDDVRLGSATAAAAAAGELDEALALMEVLSVPNRARVIEEAARLPIDQRNELVAAVARNEAWSMFLEPIDRVSDDAVRALINVPSALDVKVIDQVVKQALGLGRTELLEPLVMAFDADHLKVLAASRTYKSKAVQTWIGKTAGLKERIDGVVAKVS